MTLQLDVTSYAGLVPYHRHLTGVGAILGARGVFRERRAINVLFPLCDQRCSHNCSGGMRRPASAPRSDRFLREDYNQ